MVMPQTGQVTDLECPNCHCMTGSLIFLFRAPKGEAVMTCHCGNQHFLLTPAACHCVNCGTEAPYPTTT